MRVKTTTDPLPIARNLKGRVILRQTKDGLIAQSWPKARGPSKTPGDRWWRATWGTAAQMAARPFGGDQAFAEAWAPGTPYVPRDFLTMAALGRLFEITLPDGTIMESQTMAGGNPQATLDLVTNVPGSLLVRTDIGWVGIAPGDEGDVLTYVSPESILWAPGGAGGGNGGAAYVPTDVQGVSTDSYSSQGSRVLPLFDMRINRIWSALDNAAERNFQYSLWQYDAAKLGDPIGTPITINRPAGSGGYEAVAVPADWIMPERTNCIILITRTGDGDFANVGVRSTLQQFPELLGPFGSPTSRVRIATQAPAKGQAINENGQWHQIGFSWSPA